MLNATGIYRGLAAALMLSAAPAPADEDPLAAYLWEARPVVVFADNARDPRFQEQMQGLEDRAAGLEARDVVVLTDTDPAAREPLRRKLRPRGFMLVIIDKDGAIIQRAPRPISADALIRLIDRTPIRRREIDERRGLTD
ncbi:MAG: DUF4174 domain-containing protein [Pikeienuella sp.]